MGPDWLALRAEGAGRDISHPYVLLCEHVGVAIMGTSPDPDAVGAFRRALNAAGFVEVFGGYPPIVYRPIPPSGLSLVEVLEAAFALEPAPTLRCQERSWSGAVRLLLAPPAASDAEDAAVVVPDRAEATAMMADQRPEVTPAPASPEPLPWPAAPEPVFEQSQQMKLEPQTGERGRRRWLGKLLIALVLLALAAGAIEVRLVPLGETLRAWIYNRLPWLPGS
jgi:hypothetical protein